MRVLNAQPARMLQCLGFFPYIDLDIPKFVRPHRADIETEQFPVLFGFEPVMQPFDRITRSVVGFRVSTVVPGSEMFAFPDSRGDPDRANQEGRSSPPPRTALMNSNRVNALTLSPTMLKMSVPASRGAGAVTYAFCPMS